MDNCIHIQLMKFDDDNVNPNFVDDRGRIHLPYWLHVDYFNIFIREDPVTNTKVFYGIDDDGLTYQFKDDEDTLRVIDELVDDGYIQGFSDVGYDHYTWTENDYYSLRSYRCVMSWMNITDEKYRTVVHPKYMESVRNSPVRFYHVPFTYPGLSSRFRGEWVMTRISPLYENGDSRFVLSTDDVPSLIEQGEYRGVKSHVPYTLYHHKENISMMMYLRKRLRELGIRVDPKHTRELEQRECEDILTRREYYRSQTFKDLSPVH